MAVKFLKVLVCQEVVFYRRLTNKVAMGFKKIVMWLLPWFPILGMYNVSVIPLSYVVYTPLLLVFLQKPRTIKIESSLKLLAVVLFVVTLIQLVLPYTNTSVIIHMTFTLYLSLLYYICFTNYVRLEDFMSPYIITSIFFMLGLLYQVYLLFIQHQIIDGPIVLFPSLLSKNNVVDSEIHRPMSFFSEPQAYATWMVIFSIIMIEQKRFLLAALATLTILLSTSTEGLVLIAVVWIMFVIFSKSKWRVKVLVIAAILFIASQYTSLEFFEVGYNKAMNTDYEKNERLFQGFALFKRLDITGFLFGKGTAINSFYAGFASYAGLTGDSVYMSDAIGVFVSYGVFVGVCWWLFILKKITFKYKPLFIYSICLCIIPFAQTCFLGSNFVYLFGIYAILKTYLIKKDKNFYINESYSH